MHADRRPLETPAVGAGTLGRDARGGHLVEYLLLLGLVALLTLAGVRAFGRSSQEKALAQADCVATFACGPSGLPESAATAEAERRTDTQSLEPAGRGDGRPLWRRAVDVGKGFVVDGAWGTVTGVVGMIAHPVATAEGIWFAVTHPVTTFHGVKDAIANAWAENPERVVGAGLFELVTLPVASLKATKATKVAKANALLSQSRQVAASTEAVDAVAEGARLEARMGKHMRELASSLRAEGRLAEGADEAALAAQRAKNAAMIKANAFITDRGLSGYDDILGAGLSDRIAQLRPGQHWIDMGAGQAGAIREYHAGLNGARGAKTTAVAAVGPTDEAFSKFVRETPDFEPRYGKMLDQYGPDELARADLVTDVYGPFSYAEHMDDVLTRYANVTKPGGEIRTHIAHKTLFLDEAGAPVAASEFTEAWLGEAKGIEIVHMEPRADGIGLVLRRTSDPLEIPPLELESFGEGGPPLREYARTAGNQPRPPTRRRRRVRQLRADRDRFRATCPAPRNRRRSPRSRRRTRRTLRRSRSA